MRIYTTNLPALAWGGREAGLLPGLKQLKAEHAFWGYRRIWAYLCFVEQLPVNKWVAYYNSHYVHSAPGYKPPGQLELAYQNSHSTPCVAA